MMLSFDLINACNSSTDSLADSTERSWTYWTAPGDKLAYGLASLIVGTGVWGVSIIVVVSFVRAGSFEWTLRFMTVFCSGLFECN